MPIDLGERALVWGRLRAGSGLCQSHRTSACPSQSASGLYCPARRTWPSGFQGPSASAEPGNRPIPATVSSGQLGWLCPWGVAPSLLEPQPVSRGSPLGSALGRPSPGWGNRRALRGSSLAPPGPRGGRGQTLGPAQRPSRPRSPPGAAPSAVGGRAQPAGKQPGSPGQPRGWAATCFRSDRNSQRGRGGVGRGGGEGVVPGRLGAGTRAWPPLPPLISCGERAPGEGSPGLGLGAASCLPQTLFVSSGLGPDPPQCPGFSDEAAELADSWEPANPSRCCKGICLGLVPLVRLMYAPILSAACQQLPLDLLSPSACHSQATSKTLL